MVPAHWQLGMGPAAAVGDPEGELGAIAHAGLRVKVEVVAPGNAGNRFFFISAGEGGQTVRWLALAAMHRFSHCRPRGQRRVGERQAFAFNGQPGALAVVRCGSGTGNGGGGGGGGSSSSSSSSSRRRHSASSAPGRGMPEPHDEPAAAEEPVADPLATLRSLGLQYGDMVRVRPGLTFDASGAPAVPLRHGVPARTPFHAKAFRGTPKAALVGSTFDAGSASAKRDLDAELQKRRDMREATLCAEFKALMVNQGTFHNEMHMLDERDQRSTVELAVDYEMGRMALARFIVPRSTAEGITSPDEEIAALRDVFVAHMPLLADIFRYYCGISDDNRSEHSSGGGTAAMSRLEFCSWMTHIGLYTVKDDMREMTNVFGLEVLETNVFGGGGGGGGGGSGAPETTAAQNPDGEFMRFELMECLVRMALLKFDGNHKPHPKTGYAFPKVKVPADALRRVIEDFVVPHARETLSSNKVRQMLLKHEVQVMLQSAYAPLLAVYNFYACEDVRAHHAHARPTMCIAEFHALVTDAALLDEVEHDSKFSVEEHRGLGQQDVRLAFAEAQMDADVTVSELSEMLFCEFIEALARIALQKWGHRDDIGDKEKIGFAVDAVTRLLPEIKRGGATIVPVAQRRRKSAA